MSEKEGKGSLQPEDIHPTVKLATWSYVVFLVFFYCGRWLVHFTKETSWRRKKCAYIETIFQDISQDVKSWSQMENDQNNTGCGKNTSPYNAQIYLPHNRKTLVAIVSSSSQSLPIMWKVFQWAICRSHLCQSSTLRSSKKSRHSDMNRIQNKCKELKTASTRKEAWNTNSNTSEGMRQNSNSLLRETWGRLTEKFDTC